MDCKVFVEAVVIEPIITLMFKAQLLFIIKIWKFLFPWTLASSILKNSCWHEFQSFQQSIFQQSILFVKEWSFKVEVTE